MKVAAIKYKKWNKLFMDKRDICVDQFRNVTELSSPLGMKESERQQLG